MISTIALLALIPALVNCAPLTKRFTGVNILHNGDSNACLAVTDAVVTDNSLVNVVPCSSANKYSKWDISAGENPSVKLTGTNFCLDAGSNPSNNVRAKVYTCYPGLSQQNWYLTGDEHIAITGGTQCLDLGPSGPQTYQCVGGNTNQLWTIGGPSPTSSSSSAGPSSSSASSSSSSSAAGPTGTPVSYGYQIHPNGNTSQCLTVANGYAAVGTVVNIVDCFGGAPTDGFNLLQRWDITAGSTKVKLHGTNYCLDAGSNPANGIQAKIWTCYDVPQQQWYYTGDVDRHIAIQGGNQCLDVQAESTPVNAKPYGSLKNVQTWQCSGPDTNQLWSLSS